MRTWRFAISGLLLLTLGYGLPGTVAARLWRTTAAAQAVDYAQIIDQRSQREIVLVFWLAPETVDGNSPEVERARSVLEEYMLVGVAHARISAAGQFTFDRPAGVLIQTADGKARQPLDGRTLPPAVAGIISTLQASFSQGLGQFGEGTLWQVFDGKGIQSCQKGAFWVYYAGEQYGYATPIPGCRSTTSRPPAG
jgi:hypothetical protein